MSETEKCPKCGFEMVVESFVVAYGKKVNILKCQNPACNYEKFEHRIDSNGQPQKHKEKDDYTEGFEREYMKGVKNRRKEENIF